jgi:hypothetical protein
MFAKFLTFFDVVRPDVPAGAGAFCCSSAGASLSSAPTNRNIPRLRAPLECRWRIEPLTGALLADWSDPSANAGTRAASEPEIIDHRRCFRQSRQAARGLVLRSHFAARRAA